MDFKLKIQFYIVFIIVLFIGIGMGFVLYDKTKDLTTLEQKIGFHVVWSFINVLFSVLVIALFNIYLVNYYPEENEKYDTILVFSSIIIALAVPNIVVLLKNQGLI